jgi:hypothetical protein
MAQSDAFLAELVRVSANLDRLIADRIVGQLSDTRHEQHVDQAKELADRLQAIGRGPGRPVHAPLYISACGTQAGW